MKIFKPSSGLIRTQAQHFEFAEVRHELRAEEPGD